MSFPFTISINSDCSLLIEFTVSPCSELSDYIHQVSFPISESLLEGFIEHVNGYKDILLIFHPLLWQPDSAIQKITQMIEGFTYIPQLNHQQINIPVCYDSRLASELESLLKQKKLTLPEFIKLHTEPLYRVEMLGFLPGFFYLSGLNPQLSTPRLETPRLSVPKGSVAIGANQAGVYPLSCPGGWNIIGRTPIELFDPTQTKASLVNPMDSIKFHSISYDEYLHYDN